MDGSDDFACACVCVEFRFHFGSSLLRVQALRVQRMQCCVQSNFAVLIIPTYDKKLHSAEHFRVGWDLPTLFWTPQSGADHKCPKGTTVTDSMRLYWSSIENPDKICTSFVQNKVKPYLVLQHCYTHSKDLSFNNLTGSRERKLDTNSKSTIWLSVLAFLYGSQVELI